MPPRIPDDKRAQILTDIQAGEKSARQIGRDHGVSPGTVSKIAKDSGLTSAFERSQTQKATMASQADTKARRAQAAAEFLDLAGLAREQIRTRLGEAQFRDLVTLSGVATDKHLVLDRHDSDNQGLSAVDAWLRDIMGG